MTAELLSGYLSGKFGRTIILKIGGIVGALGFLGNQLCPYGLKPFLLLIAMMGYSSTFNVLYIYSPEIIPSSIRSTVCGALYFCGMVAPTFVPFFKTFIPGIFEYFFTIITYQFTLIITQAIKIFIFSSCCTRHKTCNH
jgi:MFS family permease